MKTDTILVAKLKENYENRPEIGHRLCVQQRKKKIVVTEWKHLDRDYACSKERRLWKHMTQFGTHCACSIFYITYSFPRFSFHIDVNICPLKEDFFAKILL